MKSVYRSTFHNRLFYKEEKTMKKKMIIFDLDGTLADTTDDLGLAMVQMLDELGFAKRSREELKSYISLGARDFVRRCLPDDKQNDEALLDRAIAQYLEKYRDCCVQNTTLYCGVPELIADLRQEGYLLCVLSNKPQIFTQKIVDTLLPGRFDAVLGCSDMPLKPDPTGARYLADRFSVSASECVLVGDSDLDLKTAQNAEMTPICVSYGYRTREFLQKAGAPIIVDSPAEVYSAIHSLPV